MRKVWQDKINEIRKELEEDCKRGLYSESARLDMVRDCVLELLDHVEKLSKLVDKHGEYVSQKW